MYKSRSWKGLSEGGTKMDSKQRKQAFKTWLVDQGYGDGTASSYASGVNKIEEDYFSSTGNFLSFFTCSVNDIHTLEGILKDYSKGGKFAFHILDHGGAKNGLKQYIKFLKEYYSKKPQVILHKNPDNIDITKMVDDNLLQTLFIQQCSNLFPGYTRSKIAQREGFIFFENKKEEQILGIMLDVKSKDANTLFCEMAKNLKDLQELCQKEKMSFQGIIIASKDKKKELDKLIGVLPNISVKTYSLSLNLLD